MIHYTKNEPAGGTPYYVPTMQNGVALGAIEQEVDGYYYFYPILRGGRWEAYVLHDIANKLDALNEAWHQKLTKELGCPEIETACSEFTPDNPPK